MRVNLWKISQVKIPTCENFCSYETPPRHTCATSHLQNLISQLRTNLRNHQSQFSQVHSSSCENFRSCETPPRHTCATSQLQKPISQLRNKLRTRLRNHLQLVKWPSSCEITFKLQKCQPLFKCLFKPLIFSIFISHSHFNLRKSSPSCETQKSQRILSKGSLEDMCLKKTTPRTSAYPLEHEPLHFSHGQDERSPNLVSISSKH